MRVLLTAVLLLSAAPFPENGNAQVYRYETPPPVVTAAGASWQLGGEPVFHAGNYYYPTGPDVFFDGRVMVRTGVFQGVPLYADVTLEPYSVVYVPVGRLLMRPYERRRAGELAGTVGSRTPSFPVESEMEASASAGRGELTPPEASRGDLGPPNDSGYVMVPVPISALGLARPQPAATQPETEFQPVGVVSVTASPAGSGAGAGSQPQGLWIEFNGARWFSAGRAVDYDANRFEPAGDYRGYPVYRERGSADDLIFVTVVHDGPIAPFVRR